MSTMPAEAVNCSADTTTPIAPSCRSGSDAQRHRLQLSAVRARHRAHRRLRVATAVYAEGAALAERLLVADPLHEDAVRQLMKLHYLAGQRSAALAAHDRFAAHSPPNSRAPSPHAKPPSCCRRSARPSAPAPALRRDIPASVLRPPRLVGRDATLASQRAAWSGQRAFWLLGEAGLGKSRLLAEFVAQAFDDMSAALVIRGTAR